MERDALAGACIFIITIICAVVLVSAAVSVIDGMAQQKQESKQ